MIKRVITAAAVLIIAGLLVIVSARQFPGIDKVPHQTKIYSIFE